MSQDFLRTKAKDAVYQGMERKREQEKSLIISKDLMAENESLKHQLAITEEHLHHVEDRESKSKKWKPDKENS